MKRVRTRGVMWTAIVGLLIVVWAGCRNDSGSNDGATERETTGHRAFKVALLTPGPTSDDGWNASAYEGLMLIRRELRAEVIAKESTNEGEFKQDFRDFARRGYRLIFAHGYEYSTHARDVAQEFPDTYFVTTGGETEYARPNYEPVVFVLDHAMYLLGVMAGKMTRTNTLGLVGGQKLPPVVASFQAFEQGARSVNPDVRFVTAYVGNWHDAVKAREQAAAQIQEGADFIVQNADKAGLGVFQAVREAQAKGGRVYAFGSNRDQNHVAPKAILASAVSNIPQAFLDIARRVQNGDFSGHLRTFTLKGGWVSVVYNPALESEIPPEVKEAVETAQQGILNGAIVVRAERE